MKFFVCATLAALAAAAPQFQPFKADESAIYKRDPQFQASLNKILRFLPFKADDSDYKRDPQFQPFKADAVDSSYKKRVPQFQPFKADESELAYKRAPQFQPFKNAEAETGQY